MYSIIELIARHSKLATLVSSDSKVVQMLFQLLEWEDERAVPMLFTALGGLREAYLRERGGDIHMTCTSMMISFN